MCWVSQVTQAIHLVPSCTFFHRTQGGTLAISRPPMCPPLCQWMMRGVWPFPCRVGVGEGCRCNRPPPPPTFKLDFKPLNVNQYMPLFIYLFRTCLISFSRLMVKTVSSRDPKEIFSSFFLFTSLTLSAGILFQISDRPQLIDEARLIVEQLKAKYLLKHSEKTAKQLLFGSFFLYVFIVPMQLT